MPARDLSTPSLLGRANVAARGLNRLEAAAYVGVGARLFDGMVEDGRMPRPRRIGARVVWDRVELDAAFEALPHDREAAGTADAEDVWSRARA